MAQCETPPPPPGFEGSYKPHPVCTPSETPSESEQPILVAKPGSSKVAVQNAPPGFPVASASRSCASTPGNIQIEWGGWDENKPKAPPPLFTTETPGAYGNVRQLPNATQSRWKNSRIPRSCTNAASTARQPLASGPVRAVKTTKNSSKKISSFDDTPGCIAPCNTTNWASNQQMNARWNAPKTVPNRVLNNRQNQPRRAMSTRNWSEVAKQKQFTFGGDLVSNTTNNWSKLLANQTQGNYPLAPANTPHSGAWGASPQSLAGWSQLSWEPISVSPLQQSPVHRTPKASAAAACFSPLSDAISRQRLQSLNPLDTSPKNPDAVVMNTPTGQFIRAGNGKWIPIAGSEQAEDPTVVERRKSAEKADRFGDWCKNRVRSQHKSIRDEFAAAVLAANDGATPPADE